MIDPDLIKVSKFVFVVIRNKTNIIPIIVLTAVYLLYLWKGNSIILKQNQIVYPPTPEVG